MNKEVKAVVDRFEENKAVILVGDDEEQLIVDRKQLPTGTKEGHWLLVWLEGKRLIKAKIDEDATEQARERIADKLGRLRRGDHRKTQPNRRR